MHPIYIVSFFNNDKLLSGMGMVKRGICVNMTTKSRYAGPPLTLAAINKREEISEIFKMSQNGKTFKILLDNNAGEYVYNQ